MRLYFAALINTGINPGTEIFERLPPAAQAHRRSAEWLLESYYYFKTDEQAAEVRANKESVFLDSGAYSAWKGGEPIALDDYCGFIERNRDIIHQVSVLDDITNPEITYNNQMEMERRGIAVLPCFHFGEDERILEYYVSRYPYITIGGLVGKNLQTLRNYLDHIWSKYLVRPDGTPKVQVHGFGVSAMQLMERYPWYSVDSSSWLQFAIHRYIRHPDHGILTCAKNSMAKKEYDKHLFSLSEPEQRAWLQIIEEHGYTYDVLGDNFQACMCFNIWAYKEIARRYTNERKKLVNNQLEIF